MKNILLLSFVVLNSCAALATEPELRIPNLTVFTLRCSDDNKTTIIGGREHLPTSLLSDIKLQLTHDIYEADGCDPKFNKAILDEAKNGFMFMPVDLDVQTQVQRLDACGRQLLLMTETVKATLTSSSTGQSLELRSVARTSRKIKSGE